MNKQFIIIFIVSKKNSFIIIKKIFYSILNVTYYIYMLYCPHSKMLIILAQLISETCKFSSLASEV